MPDLRPAGSAFDRPITVVDHDPAWADTFASIRSALAAALDGSGARWTAIEHVGSTSVPGLAAKPVIDVDVIVPAEADVPAATTALASLGYVPRGTMGIDDRWAFAAPDPPARHVYITLEGCLAVRNHLGVRDVLRRDPSLAAEYGALKCALAGRLTVAEIDAYVAAKSAVLQRVLAAAGLTAEELASIEADNRAPARTEDS